MGNLLINKLKNNMSNAPVPDDAAKPYLYDPNQYTFFGFMGITAALVFCNLGAAYGTAKSGVGICSMGVLKPALVLKSILPVIFSGVLAIYGIIVSIII